MPKTIVVKEFHSFAELAEHARFEASKGKNRQPRKLQGCEILQRQAP